MFFRYLPTAILFLLLSAFPAFGAHAISIDGKTKYPASFTSFEYTSDQARKGGTLTLHAIGGFDKLNPYTLKGEAPFGMEFLVFESLAEPSLDEPFSEYGLIAKNIELAEDGLSVTFTINSDAQFSDGSPMTPEDVAYSMETLKGAAVHPLYPFYYSDIGAIEVTGHNTVRFAFKKKNRELAAITCQMPVFKKGSFEASDPDTPPIGSGPYRVESFKRGKYITYKRNEKYWATDHPVRKYMYNFDTITVKYYKDHTVALEALKAGEFDFMQVNIAKQWARDITGPRIESGSLVKKELSHSLNAGMQGFLMNTRRDIFRDVRVRRAMGLAFDFEWTNRSLFFDQYTRSDSYFSNSPYAAKGLPEGLELQYLNTFRDELPPEVFEKPLTPVTTKAEGGLRSNLRLAKKLLAEAGWTLKDGVLHNNQGEQLSFTVLLASQSFERVMASYTANLKKIGVKVEYRTVDPTLYADRLRNFDYDMIVTTYGQSLSPGNEQRNFWHSSSADRPGSRNYAGIKSPAVDGLVDKVIYATNARELTAACRALDRVLWYGYYLVPNWYAKRHRVVFNSALKQPQNLPEYYSPIQLLMTWWLD